MKLLKKMSIVLIAAAVLAAFAGVANAQQGRGRGPAQPGGPRGQNTRQEVIELVAEHTGLTALEVMRQVRDGATLAQIITENGGDVAVVTEAITAQAQARAAERVEAGQITQERADEILAQLQESIDTILNGEYEGRTWFNRFDALSALRGMVNQLADLTGLEVRDVTAQLRDGATIADVLASSGVDEQVFVDLVIQQATERINAQVEAGRITQAQADTLLENLAERVSDAINRTHGIRRAGRSI